MMPGNVINISNVSLSIDERSTFFQMSQLFIPGSVPIATSCHPVYFSKA